VRYLGFGARVLIAGIVATVAGSAAAQLSDDVKIRIWQLELGTPVTELPAKYLDPHCGTNGGPPSLRLGGWTDFETCPVDRSTGLREVWFTEDDEPEYVARAYRVQGFDPGPYSANVLLNHKVIYSLLIDGDGLIQGYRVFTDTRESLNYRYDAEFVGVERDPAEGETPVDGRYVNELCVGVSDGRHVTIERHFFRKPGQLVFDPLTRRQTVGYFESSTRMEVIAEDLVAE
jgi:hypothetical protein